MPIAAVGLSLSYDKVAYIHQKNDTAWFNLTVKFPFAFDKNTATYTNETAPPGIEFEDDIEICSWLFLGANAVWLIMALAILLTYVSVHGGDRMESAATAVSENFTLTDLFSLPLLSSRTVVDNEGGGGKGCCILYREKKYVSFCNLPQCTTTKATNLEKPY